MSEPTASFTRTSRRSQNSSSEEAYAGLDLSVLTQPLSPAEAAEKRVKREKGLSDVGQKFSSNIPLVIEDHICAGPLYIPAPRAYRTIPLEIASVWEEQHMNDSVLKILKEHNLEWDSIDVLQFASTDQVADFILIRTINNAVDERWIKVAEAIISLCRNCGLQTINVEIADRRGLIPTISWAIAAEEPLVQDWHNVEPIILQLLRPNMTWLSIDVLVRGKRFSTFNETKVVSTPTIVIRIERDSQETWTEQRDRIDLFLQSNERYKSFAVEILRSSCDYLGGLDFSFLQEHHRKKLWERKGYMGASIGPVKSDFPAGSGTCGCFLQMRSGDTIRHLALTCFHVVLPTDPMEPEKDQPAHAVRWIRRGFALGDEGSHDLPIRMPSGNDYEQWLRDCESEIEKIETSKIGQWTFKELREMESQGDALEDRMPKIHLRDFNAKKGFLEFTQSSIDKARCANGESGENSLFGWVCGGSGLRRNRDMLMDWAVIDMLPGREPEKNEVCFSVHLSFFLRTNLQVASYFPRYGP